MWAIPSTIRRHALELGWAVFAVGNLVAMGVLYRYGTVPFHFIWVSLTLLYGYAVWRLVPTLAILTAVCLTTGAMIVLEVKRGGTSPEELTEVPLMAAMFAAMVLYAQRREEAEQEALRSREREREFVRDSSHHLKTPLTLARGYAQLLDAGDLSDRQHRDAQTLIGELDRLTRIVDGLLLHATTEATDTVNRRPIDLDELIFDVTGRWMDAVERAWFVESATASTLYGDEERLVVALDALIENAVAATVATDRIVVAASSAGGIATITVTDHGYGIPEESVDHIFERFWSDDRGRRRGTGLGLAIVKAIVDAHGGTVEVSSEPHRTTFTLHLAPCTATRTEPTELLGGQLSHALP